jgi:hypothetical protein
VHAGAAAIHEEGVESTPSRTFPTASRRLRCGMLLRVELLAAYHVVEYG